MDILESSALGASVSDKHAKDVGKFLNRILGLEVAKQNLVRSSTLAGSFVHFKIYFVTNHYFQIIKCRQRRYMSKILFKLILTWLNFYYRSNSIYTKIYK